MTKGHVKSLCIFVALAIISLLIAVLAPVTANALPSSPQIFITEVQVRDTEFVELYNPYDEQLNLQGWQLKYRGGGSTETTLKTFGPADGISSRGFLLLAHGYPVPAGVTSLNFTASLANEAGYIVLYDAAGATIDLVGWGSGTQNKQGAPAISPGVNQSIQRCLSDGAVATTDPRDNSVEFSVYDQTTAGMGVECVIPESLDVCPNITGEQEVIPDNLELNDEGSCVQPASCLVEVSEISAQPNFNNQEYVELYNSGQLLASLSLCRLKINSGSERVLSGELQPGQYAIVNFLSGTIRNSAGTVTLVNSNQESVIYSYPETSNTQTANFSRGSQTGTVSDKATPGQQNELVLLSEEELVAASGGSILAPCPVGKYRNPETNRCKNIESADTLTSCEVGQERNPDTNRCRKITTSTLTPCKEGQERNPDTSRCRKIESESSLTPCQPGQERNPETNRCRKVATTANAVLNAATNTVAINPTRFSYKLVFLVLVAVIGYGLYEYKTDIQNWYRNWRAGQQKGRPPG